MIRAFSFADLPQILPIETDGYPFPWSEAMFADSLRQGHLCRALVQQGVISAYYVASWVLDEAELLNICVAPALRGQGLAQQLLQDCYAQLREQQVMRLLLEVRPSNDAARRLYAQQGFSVIGCRRDYYPAANGRENALLMSRDLAVN